MFNHFSVFYVVDGIRLNNNIFIPASSQIFKHNRKYNLGAIGPCPFKSTTTTVILYRFLIFTAMIAKRVEIAFHFIFDNDWVGKT